MLGYVLRHMLNGELYWMEVTETGFAVTLTTAYYQYLLENLAENMVPILRSIKREEKNGVLRFEIELPYISYPNFRHNKLDWNRLRTACYQLQSIFQLSSLGVDEKEGKDEFYLSKKPQLVLLETSYTQTDDPHSWAHGASMAVGFNEEVCRRLAQVYTKDTHIPQCEEVMGQVYNRLTASSKKKFLAEEKNYNPDARYRFMGSYVAMVRAGGTPHFVVPGSCACLGENPDEFEHKFEMYSHNLDTTLQQMCMIAGIVSFWNIILKPLMENESST